MRVRLTQIDGKLPNLALMRLSAYHKDQGDEVHFTKQYRPEITEPEWDRVYGSSIFKFSSRRLTEFQTAFPDAIVGGTGTLSVLQVEDIAQTPERYDYEIYPDFTGSLGFTARGCRLSCKFCLTPGNLIITGNGLKKIEDVQLGDMVLSHTGKYRRVVKTMYRWYDGDVVTLKSGALSELFPTTVTDNHRIWTRHVSYYSGGQRLTLFNWMESGSIRAGYPHRARDQYAYPRTVSTVEAKHAPGTDWAQYDVGQSVITLSEIAINSDLMELLGFYLAEGHLTANGRPHLYGTIFSFGHSETERVYALRVSETLRSYGMDPEVKPVPTGTRVTAYSGRFARWLAREFGTGSATKRIPLWVRLLPVERLKELLQAWCEGDGWYHVKKGSRTWKITTTSPDLAVSCREMALKCGYVATINRHQTSDVIQGRKVNVKPAYTVIFHEANSRTRHSVVHDHSYVYQLAQESEVRRYAGFVYNLEVEEDHSYCTPAFAIANCVVPQKEGKPKEVNTINEIWRGDPYPKHIHLLDNDFFGQPHWKERVREIIDGGFRVCFNQGINTRLINDESAEALASIPYYDDQFKVRRLYTAWDNLKDFKVFMTGVDRLEKAGVNPKDILAYMLIGFAKGETMEEIEWRFGKMKERGIFAFPMVFDRSRPELRAFARWAIRGIHNVCSFKDYHTGVRKRDPNVGDFFENEVTEEAAD